MNLCLNTIFKNQPSDLEVLQLSEDIPGHDEWENKKMLMSHPSYLYLVI